MAGAGMGKPSRGRYTSAGYVYNETTERRRENDLYIEEVQAGSARDLLRDNNRIGYSADEQLDGDGLPFSFFIEEEERIKKKKQANQAQEERADQTDERTFIERAIDAMRAERGATVACAVLLVTMVTMLSVLCSSLFAGVRLQDTIEMYNEGIAKYEQDIADDQDRIKAASDKERIRIMAQNELGMLRSERMETHTIYLQTSGLAPAKTDEAPAQTERGLLDWVLSVADIFDFKS